MSPFFRPPFRPTPRNITLLTLSLPALLSTRAAMSTNIPPPNPPSKTQFPTRPYTPCHPTYPYTPHDFLRADESPDTDFYAEPRFVTHIDDHAIGLLKEYYEGNLPGRGRVLDLCSSWVSHFPGGLEGRAVRTKRGGDIEQGHEMREGEGEREEEEGLEVVGLGMNTAEMAANPILKEYILRDLNTEPDIPERVGLLDATVCTVSIDYLTQPLAVMQSLLASTKVGGKVHLVVSNRCFPSKVVGRWLRVGEEERVQMVGDYLWWGGWRGVDVVEVCGGRGGGWFGGWDPLWVVRGVKLEGEGEGEL